MLIGTSGWQYAHWKRVFYPDKMPQRVWLEHHSALFQTVEVNNAFGTLVLGAKNRDVGPKLSLLNETGEVSSTFTLDRGQTLTVTSPIASPPGSFRGIVAGSACPSS